MKEKLKLLKPEDVAAMLGVARKTVIVWARLGQIPCVRVGRFVRFDPAEIDRWLDRRRR